METDVIEKVVQDNQPAAQEQQSAAPVVDTPAPEKEENNFITLPKRNIREIEDVKKEEPQGDAPTKPITETAKNEWWKEFEAEDETSFKTKYQKLHEKSQYVDELEEDVMVAAVLSKQDKRTFHEAYKELMSLKDEVVVEDTEDFILSDKAKEIFLQGEKVKRGKKFNETTAAAKYEKLKEKAELEGDKVELSETLSDYAELINEKNKKQLDSYYEKAGKAIDKTEYKEKIEANNRIIEQNKAFSKVVLANVESALKADAREYIQIPTGEQDSEGNEVMMDIPYISRTKEDNEAIKKNASDLFNQFVEANGARLITSKEDKKALVDACFEEAKAAWEFANMGKIKSAILQAASLFNQKQEFRNLGAGVTSNLPNSQPQVQRVKVESDKDYIIDEVTGFKIKKN